MGVLPSPLTPPDISDCSCSRFGLERVTP